MSAEPKSLIRSWRNEAKFSLEHVCDLLERHGVRPRPSAAKLSRIERDQEIPLDMLPAFEAITAIPAKDLRPEIAKIFVKSTEAAQ